MNHHLCHCYCFADGSGESSVKRVRVQPVQLCNVRLMWWHLVHDHTSHVSAVLVIHCHFDTVLYPESCSRIKGVPSYIKTPTSSTRVPSMFLHSLLTPQKVRRGHVLRYLHEEVLSQPAQDVTLLGWAGNTWHTAVFRLHVPCTVFWCGTVEMVQIADVWEDPYITAV